MASRATKAPSSPAVPFALTSFYDHLDRDTEGYAASGLALATQAWSVESGYGLRLLQDWIQAYGQLVLAPYVALARLSWISPSGAGVRPGPP
jgi:hypothetical protein